MNAADARRNMEHRKRKEEKWSIKDTFVYNLILWKIEMESKSGDGFCTLSFIIPNEKIKARLEEDGFHVEYEGSMIGECFCSIQWEEDCTD